MNKYYCLPLFVVAFGSSAFGASDPCRGNALSAAEDEYKAISGNPHHGTLVNAIKKGEKYEVTVGIGDPEDGAKVYIVTFSNGCNSTPDVKLK
jgi:hypothetical protein